MLDDYGNHASDGDRLVLDADGKRRWSKTVTVADPAAAIVLAGHARRIEALEQLTAWASEPQPDTTAVRLANIECVLLWLAKQPWEVDAATTWDQLIEKAHAEPAKAMKFREAVSQ